MTGTRCASWPTFAAAALVLLPSCGSTLDPVGCTERYRAADGGAPVATSTLAALVGPSSYRNLFRELLGKSDGEINAKIANTFNQLFHGDSSSEAIYVQAGTDQAYIQDVLKNGKIRTEGIGLGMIFAVELDKRDEFDKLWRYAKANQISDGPSQGYFPSYCYNGTADFACSDPFGLEQITTALLLARGRWKSSPGTIDYGQEAASLLDLIRNKESYNCGIEDGVTAPFDPESKLPYDFPSTASANISRPSIVMPAYYELWKQATGDAFWGDAAIAARAYWQASSNLKTGLMPEKAAFDGMPVTGSHTFQPECDRTFFNMALDHIWSKNDTWIVGESNRLLQFFYAEGIDSYGQTFSLDGMNVILSTHDQALVAGNGVLALVADTDHRSEFVSEVWSGSTPTGPTRYYPGIMHLWALLMLSGQMRVY
jgi:oligosaccharide reducing-end xylanase